MSAVKTVKADRVCFECDETTALSKRALAEGLGTFFLTLAAIGSALSTDPVSGHGASLFVRLTNALATAGALAGLIIALRAISGGHFNPLITGLQWLSRKGSLRSTMGYVAAQCGGALLGAWFAGTLFDISANVQSGVPSWRFALSEFVSTSALMLVVLGCIRAGRGDSAAFAVGAWLFAAIVATPTGSYANPAIALAAALAPGPIALSRAGSLIYIIADTAGALLAFGLVAYLFADRRHSSDSSLD